MLRCCRRSTINTLVEKRSHVRKSPETFGWKDKSNLCSSCFRHRIFSHAGDWREIETSDSQYEPSPEREADGEWWPILASIIFRALTLQRVALSYQVKSKLDLASPWVLVQHGSIADGRVRLWRYIHPVAAPSR